MKKNTGKRVAPKSKNRQYNGRRKSRFIFPIVFIVVLLVTLAISAFCLYQSNHFKNGTFINGVDCSHLTVEESLEKLNQHISETNITLGFIDTSYTLSASSFGLSLSSTEELQGFLETQHSSKEEINTFTLSNFSLEKDRLKETLSELPSFMKENMVSAQDAYVFFSEEDHLLTLVPEVRGNIIDFDTAFNLAVNQLQSGIDTIDFSSLIQAEPEITSSKFEENVSKINAILNTTITYNITDSKTLVLDKSIMKDWIAVSEDGMYSIDIDSHLPEFINLLEEESKDTTVFFEFEATDLGTVTVPAKKLSLNKEAELSRLKSCLENGKSDSLIPLYHLEIGNSYVEVDLGRQHVWMYVDGICILDTDCVTGNKGNHDTREGYFFLTGKNRNAILRDWNDNGTRYASPVSFWMPFDGGIGLHDASWRTTFGGEIYIGNGSHGCVNLPKAAAEKIYNNITFDMPIIVYDSSK